MAKRRPRQQTIKTTIAAAVSDAFAEVESLKDELQEWLDSIPENLQGGEKAQQLEEAISALEAVDEPEAPDEVDDGAEVSYVEDRGKGRYPSRATRCANAVAMVDAVIDALEGNDEDPDEIVQFVEELREARDGWDGVEFPGMFG